jgi:hypothetical protein
VERSKSVERLKSRALVDGKKILVLKTEAHGHVSHYSLRCTEKVDRT